MDLYEYELIDLFKCKFPTLKDKNVKIAFNPGYPKQFRTWPGPGESIVPSMCWDAGLLVMVDLDNFLIFPPDGAKLLPNPIGYESESPIDPNGKVWRAGPGPTEFIFS